MDKKTLILLIFTILHLLMAAQASSCNRSCGTGSSAERLYYPFGFSAGCEIVLNCSNTGDILVNEFPVQVVDRNYITLTIQAKCDRSIDRLQHLFHMNYAPATINAFLMQNCTVPVACPLPNTNVQTSFQCSNGSFMSCYSDTSNLTRFLSYEKVRESGCQYLVSAISSANDSVTDVSLDVEVVKLEWWLDGKCNCSENADCRPIISPVTNGDGYRCSCRKGFVGDGFTAGSGCREASSKCRAAKFMSAQCGGKAIVALLGAAIAIGAIVMTAIGLACCKIRQRANKKNKKKTTRRLCETTGVTIPIHPYKEIERATNNFSDIQCLGTGAYGRVYAGKLQNNKWVAIKRIKNRDFDGTNKVVNEIKLICSVNHPNLVRLLGCCIENGEQILVYEFMPNGTLFQHLHREKGEGLPWQVRLSIATETAKAIGYLHSSIDPPIFHRDVKSSNILLDYNFSSKVADFGLSRVGLAGSSHISTAPQGTPGYLDPEYHQNYHLSDKSDVYSFGVVLVEIITAMKVVDFNRVQNEVNLAALAIDRIANGCLDEIIDPFIERDEWTVFSLNKVAELAFRCLADAKDMRPSMIEVAGELEEIVKSNKDLDLVIKRDDSCLNSMRMSENSPVSVQDSWLSEDSCPSSNSLLCNVT